MLAMLILSLAYSAEETDKRIIQYQKQTEIDFESVEVEGKMIKPDGAIVTDRSKATFNPMIQLRQDFLSEMSQSVKAIK